MQFFANLRVLNALFCLVNELSSWTKCSSVFPVFASLYLTESEYGVVSYAGDADLRLAVLSRVLFGDADERRFGFCFTGFRSSALTRALRSTSVSTGFSRLRDRPSSDAE